MIIHVGKTVKKLMHTYKDVKFDEDGWADTTKFLPMDLDLCILKFENKTIFGWYSGNSWDGMRVKEGEIPLYWKLKN